VLSRGNALSWMAPGVLELKLRPVGGTHGARLIILESDKRSFLTGDRLTVVTADITSTLHSQAMRQLTTTNRSLALRRSVPRPAFVSLLLLFACLCAACNREQEVVVTPGVPVILISIDTLRSDHLAVYGYESGATPNLDAFRKEAILYQRAYSHSPMTLPAHVSMLTGKLPSEHGVRNNIGFRFDGRKSPSLPSLLKDKGYTSGAAVSSYLLRAQTGMGEGFDWYEDSISPPPGAAVAESQRSGTETTRLALRWIRSVQRQRFFLFLHLYEPHVPYDPPEPFRSRLTLRYDGEIAAADAVLGSFFNELRRLKIYDRALIIVTSDHGEGLGDHREEEHSILLYREALQVPLMMKLPSAQRGGETIEAPAQLIDLFSTVLSITGSSQAGGRRPTLLDIDSLTEPRPIYSETLFPRIHLGWSALRSVISGNHHYIESPKPELYDLDEDPAERVNGIAEDSGAAASLRSLLEAQPDTKVAIQSTDPGVAARLAALGYGETARKGTKDVSLPNPVDQIHLLSDVRRALELADSGRGREARAALSRILDQSPSLLEVRLQLALLLVANADDEGALTQYKETMRQSTIFLPDVVRSIAGIQLRLGRLDEAAKHAELLRKEDGFHAAEILTRVAMRRGQLPEARKHARAAMSAGPMADGKVLLAEICQREGNMDEALKLLDEAEREASDLGIRSTYRLNFVRGDAFARMDRLDEARLAYEKEINDFPANLEAYGALCVVYFLQEKLPAVQGVLRRMTLANPNRRAYAMAAKTMEAFGDSESASQWRAREK